MPFGNSILPELATSGKIWHMAPAVAYTAAMDRLTIEMTKGFKSTNVSTRDAISKEAVLLGNKLDGVTIRGPCQ